MINAELKQYIEEYILPLYDGFDAAHRRDHVDMVINQSMTIAKALQRDGTDVDESMVYTIAAFHDTGLVEDRKTHHLVSGRIIRADSRLKEWFMPEQIETMAQAVEDHRASSDHEPRSLYGKIVAEADRFIDPDKIITRTVQYGLEHYPELDKEGHYRRTITHALEKYGDGGYLKLWFSNSPNAARLEALRAIIRNEPELRMRFDAIYERLMAEMPYQSEAWRQMMSGQPYDAVNPLLSRELRRVRRLVKEYNDANPCDTEALHKMLRSLLGSCGEHITVNQPFHCDYGVNIHVGENFFANFNLTILDEAKVTIGSNVFIGPNVSIYTACHPLDPVERNKGIEWSLPVTIGDNCWLGGDVTILPGVVIGDNVTIGAGSVVTKSIPSNEVWAGNPAKCIKKI